MPKEPTDKTRYTLKKIPLAKLQKGHYQHEALSGALVKRIKAYKAILHEVEPASLEETIDDFLRDGHPEKEIAIWEAITECYQQKINQNPSMTLQEKINVFALILSSTV
jgi:hypothetical protein